MAGIPQISNPAGGRGYVTSNLSNKSGGSESDFFDVIQIEQPIATQQTADRDASDKSGLMSDQKEFLQMSVKIAKDPTMAVESLKQIINDDLLAIAKTNGYTELHGELDSVMKALFISPEDLVREIQAQENENTMFSNNKFYDILRSVAANAKQTGNEELKNAIGNMLKAINFSQNKDEILNALSFNMEFLSKYFAPNKGLSNDLNQLAELWGGNDAMNSFEQLRDETLSILKNVSYSLLNNERTQVLIPLIVHNLSRYNTNQNMLSEYFSNLLTLVPNQQDKQSLQSEFDKLLKQLFPQNTETNNPQSKYVGASVGNQQGNYVSTNNENIQTQQGNAGAENMQAQQVNANAVNTQNPMTQYVTENSENPQAQHADTNTEKTQNQALNTDNKNAQNSLQETQISSTDDTRRYNTVGTLRNSEGQHDAGNNTYQYNNTTNREINQPLNENLLKENSVFRFLEDNIGHTEHLNLDTEQMHIPVRSYLLGKSNGMTAIADILKNVMNEPAAQNAVISETAQIRDIGTLVDYLNDFLKLMPDVDERQVLYESLLEVVNSMADEKELPLERQESPSLPPKTSESSSLEKLISFVEKNIDHPALKTINNYNASNLLQSLINAPGVFTPLSHYIIPLQIEDTRAFGELWVNNEEDSQSAGTSKKCYHLFLTFDVDSIGRFEIDMRSVGEDVNIALFHPEDFAQKIDPIVKKVNRVIAGSGYNAKSFKTGPLVKPHNLVEIFPNITERREGFNVTA